MNWSSFKARICKLAVLLVSISCLVVYKLKISLDDESFQPVDLGQTSMTEAPSKNSLASTYMIQESGNESGRFHVILTFRLLNVSSKNENERMMEYIHCLKTFLNNTDVKQVHLMYDSPEMPGYIQKNAGPQRKLILHKVNSSDIILNLHQFAFTHLQGELVIITQADIIMGEGFEKVNKQTLIDKKVFYALSRHSKFCEKEWNQCKKYVGSHDMFVFVPQGQLTPEATDLLSHPVFSYGTENVVLFVYSRLMKYNLFNPCTIIKIYHYHCSGYRAYPKKQKRINSRTSVIVRPSEKLGK